MALVTVAICTFDRSTDVRRCLTALRAQDGALSFPILLIDNASSPAEASALSALADQFSVPYHRCEEPGLSHARNLAAQLTTTEWVAYLDDDAVPYADWMVRLDQTLARQPNDVVAVGGKITPRWPEGPAPDYITPRWEMLLSCIDKDLDGDVGGAIRVCGANFAVRTSRLWEVGGFAAELGRVSSKLISGEEAYLIARFEDMGLRTRYESAFGVEHVIPEARLEPEWAYERAYWEGITRVKIERAMGRAMPFAMSPLKLAAALPLLYGMSLFSRNVDYRLRFHMALGSLTAQFSRT